MQDPREVENHMVLNDADEYEYGSAWWVRKQHRKADPDRTYDEQSELEIGAFTKDQAG